MNFNKEYIELCKCTEIQELRPILQRGDWATIAKFEPIWFGSEYLNKDYTWLPTGDQLDEEIVKICKENEFEYRIDCGFTNDFATAVEVYNFEEKIMEIELWDDNPLIAKIKLLIQLKGM